MIAAFLKYRWLILGGVWLISLLGTAYKVWDLTSDSCETSALKATVNDERALNEIRNNRPDDDGFFGILRSGSF